MTFILRSGRNLTKNQARVLIEDLNKDLKDAVPYLKKRKIVEIREEKKRMIMLIQIFNIEGMRTVLGGNQLRLHDRG